MEKSSFFNSVDGDRKYNAESLANYFSSFIGNGIFPTPSTNLQVLSSNDMAIKLSPGKAWINGYYYQNTDYLILNLDPADGVLNRIDRIVLRLDYLNREIKTYVKKGELTSLPVASTLQRDADAFELGIADIVVNKGAISTTQANITDLRFDNNFCGIVKGTVDQIDTSNLFAQYESGFKLWFDGIKGQLGEDAAGNLANLIASIQTQVNAIPVYQKSSTSEAEEGTNTEKIMTPKTTKDAILKLAPTPPVVTTSVAGLMSPTDKTKLNNLPSKITISTANPSGGTNGDLWVVV